METPSRCCPNARFLERYRALVDASEEAFEIIDIANREARFALIVMGALNAVPLVVLSRADAFSVLSRGEQT